jgi:hypothetical protein
MSPRILGGLASGNENELKCALILVGTCIFCCFLGGAIGKAVSK